MAEQSIFTRRTAIVLIWLVSSACIVSCTTSALSDRPQSEPIDFDDLRGNWAIEQFETRQGRITPRRDERKRYFVVFRDDAVIGGTPFGEEVVFGAGCNSDIRTITIDGDILRLRPEPEIEEEIDFIVAGVGCSPSRERRREEIIDLFDNEPRLELISDRELTITGKHRALYLLRDDSEMD